MSIFLRRSVLTTYLIDDRHFVSLINKSILIAFDDVRAIEKIYGAHLINNAASGGDLVAIQIDCLESMAFVWFRVREWDRVVQPVGVEFWILYAVTFQNLTS